MTKSMLVTVIPVGFVMSITLLYMCCSCLPLSFNLFFVLVLFCPVCSAGLCGIQFSTCQVSWFLTQVCYVSNNTIKYTLMYYIKIFIVCLSLVFTGRNILNNSQHFMFSSRNKLLMSAGGKVVKLVKPIPKWFQNFFTCTSHIDLQH